MTTVDRRVHAASALLVVAAVVVMTQVELGPRSPGGPCPVMTVVVAVSEVCNIKLQIGKQHWLVAFTEAALSAAFVFAPGSWSVLAVTAGRPHRDAAHAT